MGQTGSNFNQANRSGVLSGANDLPPLLFHQVHGDNIRVSRDGAVARRAESFCKGVTFTNRPVKISEKVYVKFLDVSNNWSGVIRFGFTCNDPSNLRHALPKYACPDLTNKAGYWAKALAERFCERDTVLFYYVTHAGDVHFGINGEEKGLFFGGVETRGQLWAMVDVYGNSTAVELLDARQQLNNSRSRCPPVSGSPSPDREVDRLMADLSLQPVPPTPVPDPRIEDVADPMSPSARFQQPPAHFNPLPFHRTRGRNIRLSNDRCIASRTDTEFCQGYVFTSRPIQLGERIFIQVLATEPMYLGALALGLTSCDPSALRPHIDLPDDSDLLLDRPDYWVVSKDVAGCPRPGDQLAFCITHAGEVQMSKNGGPPSVLMHVDQSLTLWAFLDVYGSTQKIRILGSSTIVEPPRQPTTCSPPPPTVAVAGASNGRSLRVNLPEVVQLGGGVLVVNLPPPAHPHPHPHPPPNPSATLLSTYSHTYIEPVSSSQTSYSTLDSPALREWAERSVSAPNGGGECSVCYERQIDSVLYMCGHMCMCYDCAVQQWRGKGGGHCPMCRALIRDVIRTYKS